MTVTSHRPLTKRAAKVLRPALPSALLLAPATAEHRNVTRYVCDVIEGRSEDRELRGGTSADLAGAVRWMAVCNRRSSGLEGA